MSGKSDAFQARNGCSCSGFRERPVPSCNTVAMGNHKGSPEGEASEGPGNATLSGTDKRSVGMNPTPQQL
jgi:hypothetical protein